MALLTDEPELKRVVEFVVSRWLLDHHFGQIQMQGLLLGIVLMRSDYLRIVRAYSDKCDVNAPCDPSFNLREWM